MDNNANVNSDKTSDSSKKKSNSRLFADGKTLNILAASAANAISGNLNNKEIELLAIFFSTLSDALGTIAAANYIIEENADIPPILFEDRIL